jgi:hypothetical protein
LHSIINDGEEMIKFLTFGGYTGKQKKKQNKKEINDRIIVKQQKESIPTTQTKNVRILEIVVYLFGAIL